MPYTTTPDRFILAVKKTPVILNAILRGVTQAQALAATDGSDGWSVVETLCHMVDFEIVSLARVQTIVKQSGQPLTPLDPAVAAQQRDYKSQSLAAEFATYKQTRAQLVAFIGNLTPEQWQHTGIHREFGSLTLIEYLLHVGWHDLNHIEQITRSLGLSDYVV